MPTPLFEQPEEELHPENEFISNIEKEIAERKRDETGAEREQFAYESARKMFEEALTYEDGTWKPKEGYEDIQIHAVTLPTLSEVNTLGHAEGDQLLNGFTKHLKGNHRVFHTLGADFLVISKGNVDIPQETLGEPIQGVPRLIAQRSISLEELTEIANKDMPEPGENGEIGIAQREFVRALFIETSRQREEEKLRINIRDFRERFGNDKEQADKHYETFLRYQFEGLVEDEIDTSNAEWILNQNEEEVETLCKNTAALRTLGPVVEREWEKKIQSELRLTPRTVDETRRSEFMVSEPNYRTQRRKQIEKVEAYLEDPNQEFPKNELISMLEQLGKGDEIDILEQILDDKEIEKRMANTIMSRYTLEFDKMTGFKEKSSFAKELIQDIENGHEVSAAIIDLGYLKYFNYLGNRELGDHAIKKSAWIMEMAVEDLKSLDVEVYRIGGDEFAIRAANPRIIAKIQSRIKMAVETLGDIPSDGKTHSYYEKQRLEFNVGACDTELAKKIAEIVKDEFPGEALTVEEQQKRIADLLVQVADLNLESNKTVVRFRTILRKLNNVSEGKNVEIFKKFLAFSGKALRGVSLEELKAQLEKVDMEEEDLRIWENVLNKFTGQDYHYGNDYSEQLVDRVRQAIRANR